MTGTSAQEVSQAVAKLRRHVIASQVMAAVALSMVVALAVTDRRQQEHTRLLSTDGGSANVTVGPVGADLEGLAIRDRQGQVRLLLGFDHPRNGPVLAFYDAEGKATLRATHFDGDRLAQVEVLGADGVQGVRINPRPNMQGIVVSGPERASVGILTLPQRELPVLLMADREGIIRMGAGLDRTGQASISFHDQRNVKRLSVGLAQAGTPTLSFWDDEQVRRLWLGVNPVQTAGLSLSDAAGHERGLFTSEPDGQVELGLHADAIPPVLRFSVKADGQLSVLGLR